jgi:hypothetical protein
VMATNNLVCINSGSLIATFLANHLGGGPEDFSRDSEDSDSP